MAMFLSVVAGEKTTPNIFPARKALDACREVTSYVHRWCQVKEVSQGSSSLGLNK